MFAPSKAGSASGSSKRVATFSAGSPAADFLDSNAVVQVAFGMADAGLQNVAMDFQERQALLCKPRLIKHETDVLEVLGDTPFGSKIAVHHLLAFGIHDLRIGRRAAGDFKEPLWVKPKPLGEDEPFRQSQ